MPHQQFQSCIDACNNCAVACDHCAASCLGEKDVKAMARCIQLDMDCAAICRLAAGYMARGSELAGMICEACAQECERHQMDHCRECAQACRRCAEECRRMASSQPRRSQAGQAARPSAH
jgi:hypothetical protein